RALMSRVFSQSHLDEGMQYTLSRLVSYTLIAIGLIIGLQMIGFDLSALAVFGGLFGIGLGFGLQNIFSNFVSGLILLIERPIKIGDKLSLGNISGTVMEIGLRVTIINTFDNESIIVPNSELVSKQVINWSYKDPKLRVRIPIGVSYGTDVEQVQEVLLDVVMQVPDILEEPGPQVFFSDFGDSSLDFELRVWVPSPQFRAEVANKLRFAIRRAFQQAGIEIPFPQRDVRLVSEIPM
ncbi:MAG: mechanosensitive ion channel family protein, partial [Candidatus Bipolaricaulia bacterium]